MVLLLAVLPLPRADPQQEVQVLVASPQVAAAASELPQVRQMLVDSVGLRPPVVSGRRRLVGLGLHPLVLPVEPRRLIRPNLLPALALLAYGPPQPATLKHLVAYLPVRRLV